MNPSKNKPDELDEGMDNTPNKRPKIEEALPKQPVGPINQIQINLVKRSTTLTLLAQSMHLLLIQTCLME